ncbi:type-2 ice-structuring protein-like [Cheilinus undulatus]|uniref:type-2 ice-structuring protein-like n=1 Tax=Cheilinus undulatus TaxID=241271 RepID=UPI001BD3C16B|nr:type-2 ice-structuring protein-like [Cheilinus undulatus]
MKMWTVSALLCAMMAVTVGAAADLHVFSKSSNCPCGWTEFQDRCYIYVSKTMTWSEAQRNCQNMKANLASVRSFEEYTAIRGLTAVDQYGSTWIGASDAQQERYWFWADGTPFTFTYWCSYQPDHSGVGPHCLHMNFGVNKCWDDAECKARFPSVCAKRVLA